MLLKGDLTNDMSLGLAYLIAHTSELNCDLYVWCMSSYAVPYVLNWHCNLKHNSCGPCGDRKAIVKLYSQQLGCSLVPRRLPSFVLRFAFSIMHEVEDSEKWGRPDLIHHVSDVRWGRGSRKEEGTNHKNNALDHSFKCSTADISVVETTHLHR